MSDEQFKWWSSSCGRIELQVHVNDVDRIAVSGQNDVQVAGVSEHAYMALQLAKVDPTLLREHLKEYGAWDEQELSDHEQNLQRMLWLAAWDVKEEMYAEESDAA